MKLHFRCSTAGRAGVAVAFALASSVTLAFPELSGDADRPECAQALSLAHAMFKAPSVRLYAPLHVPRALESRVVLAAESLDVSGGDALEASNEFERIAHEGSALYWARHADEGKRLVVLATGRGWRGDTYSSYMLDASQTPEVFAREEQPTALVADSWRPPIVLRATDAGPNWLIDVGQPFEVLAAWRVYVAPGEEAVCVIRFHDAAVSPTEQLPEAVRLLLPILDKAIGSGDGEGTLQQTARLRLQAQHVLANVALRPWAVSPHSAYNTRARVDSGLRAWAQGDARQAALYGRLVAGEEAARGALAQYYAEHFGLAPDMADEVGTWMFDLLIRAHFVFPREGAAPDVGGSPWPVNRAASPHAEVR